MYNLDYFVDKIPSTYEQKHGHMEHEQALEPILKSLIYCSRFIIDYNQKVKEEDRPEDEIEAEYFVCLRMEDIYEKILSEVYLFNSFESLRELIKIYCREDMGLSKRIIFNCFRGIVRPEESYGYLEALKELLLLQDSKSDMRRDLVFGFPTIMEQKDLGNKMKIAFQINKDLLSSSLKYRSSPITSITSNSFLTSLAIYFEKKLIIGFVFLSYLLEVMMESDEVFQKVIHLPSPFYMYANYHDFFFPMVKNYFVDCKNRTFTYGNLEPGPIIEDKVKENLKEFETKYRAYLKTHHPEASEEEYTFTLMSAEEACNGDAPNEKEEKAKPTKPIFSLSNSLIIGCAKTEELKSEYTMYESENEDDMLVLKVSQVPVLAIPSKPTGETNTSLPQYYENNTSIFTDAIPEDSQLYKFVGENEVKPDYEVSRVNSNYF